MPEPFLRRSCVRVHQQKHLASDTPHERHDQAPVIILDNQPAEKLDVIEIRKDIVEALFLVHREELVAVSRRVVEPDPH